MFCPLQCGAAFQEDDVIVLNGTKEDVETLKSRMEERRLRTKLGKVTGPWGPPLPSLESSGAAGPVANPRTARLGAAFGRAVIEALFTTSKGLGSRRVPVRAHCGAQRFCPPPLSCFILMWGW